MKVMSSLLQSLVIQVLVLALRIQTLVQILNLALLLFQAPTGFQALVLKGPRVLLQIQREPLILQHHYLLASFPKFMCKENSSIKLKT